MLDSQSFVAEEGTITGLQYSNSSQACTEILTNCTNHINCIKCRFLWDSTCCSHAWSCYAIKMRYLVMMYMKSERTWTIPMPLTWMIYIFIMVDNWRGSLIDIYIELPRIFKAFLRFYFLKQPFYRFIKLLKVRQTCTGDVVSSYSQQM